MRIPVPKPWKMVCSSMCQTWHARLALSGRWPSLLRYGDIPRRYRAWQTVEGRLYGVLWIAYCAIRSAEHSGTELRYTLLMDHGRRRYLTLKLVTGPGDHGEPVVTIMLPDKS